MSSRSSQTYTRRAETTRVDVRPRSSNALKIEPQVRVQQRLDTPYRPAHLRPLPTGEELKVLRRPLLVKRFFYLAAISVVAFSVLTAVVAQAEIGKMSLSVTSLDSTISTLKASNQQLGLTEASLGSPARIAQYAQSQLHMTFATSNGVSSNGHLGLYSASSQPYSEYYTPGGEAPTTTVPPTPAIQPSQTVTSTASGSTATTASVTSKSSGQPASSTTSPSTTASGVQPTSGASGSSLASAPTTTAVVVAATPTTSSPNSAG